MPYCYDFIKEFTEAQKIEKPKKIFKTPLEQYKFIENIYNKEFVYPEEVLQRSEYNIKKNKERKKRKRRTKNKRNRRRKRKTS